MLARFLENRGMIRALAPPADRPPGNGTPNPESGFPFTFPFWFPAPGRIKLNP